MKTDTVIPNHPPPQVGWSPPEMIEPEPRKDKRLIQLWNALTTIPEAPPDADLAQREAVRRSRLTSNVLFFFVVMVVALLPACYIAPGHSYFWLDLALAIASIFALALNRQGYTLAAGILVNLAGFSILTIALFTTIPFDETTLQGYDMYVIVELLAVSLLPMRSIFLVAITGTICIIGTLVYMPHTAVLDTDLHDRLLIIIARPIGTLFLAAGVTYTVTEAVPDGWTQTSVSCVDTASSIRPNAININSGRASRRQVSADSLTTGARASRLQVSKDSVTPGTPASVPLAAGQNVTCTFTNTHNTHTVTLIKKVSDSNN